MKIKFTLPFFLAINLQCLAIPYKNVCNKFSGYLWPDLAESCYHDPDTSLEVVNCCYYFLRFFIIDISLQLLRNIQPV